MEKPFRADYSFRMCHLDCGEFFGTGAEFSDAGREQERAQIFFRAIESDVTVKIAINRIARVTRFRAPDFAT